MHVADQPLPSAKSVFSTDEHDSNNIQVISSSKRLRGEIDADNSQSPFYARSEISSSNAHKHMKTE
ncbi:hypothetical protein Lalb_Chr09g0321581 [Lupinus albus]|uniref:Uncharacterized protein n=1 Tax=Lupinus albus TaxID=3870 RepID=A0A6A4PZD3_LUPAL|nr:hypothetical protein Lalb_Chr09g0321581 [Lupinus albus]